jgi:phenylpropionate dioxygenase-like ring-hydroxylating dioxygenase large terminal subunit
MQALEQICPDSADSQPQPAGGAEPDRFDPKEAWYPVFYLADLDKTKPAAFTLLGRDLIIWWDASAQTWRTFDDQCPHRLAPLSQGRIADDGLLECPYHGWAFAGSGDCQRIPQQAAGGTAEQSQRACVASLPTVECQGLLFVYAGQPQNAAHTQTPRLQPLDESPEDWVCLDIFRDLPYDALTLLENVLDSSHVPFTHHRSVGNRANAAPVELEVISSSKQGFQGVWAEGPRRGKLGKQDTFFIAPNLMWHDLTAKQLGRTITAVYATPIRKGECRLFARFPFQFAAKLPAFLIKLTPRWYSHIGQNAILEDDQIFLHYQERYLEAKGGSANVSRAFYLPTKADRFVFEFRQWLDQYQADPFPNEPLPPPRSTTQLLDRYHSHTEKCQSCRNALAQIQKLRFAAGVVAAIALAISPLIAGWGQASGVTTAALVIGAIATGAIWLGLGRLEKRFYQGRLVPPRNLPEKS